MPATIRDIKDRTGLSLATISKYLNGGNVLPENRIKIEAAINELHYEVNEIARGLVTNKTKTIGVSVYSIESLFNGTLLKYVGDALRKEGYGLLICDSNQDEETERKNIKFLLGKKVDGLIAIPVRNGSGIVELAKNAEVPLVLLDRANDNGDCDCVRIDNRMAALRATNVLIENGHSDIAIISSEREYTGIERCKGFTEAMENMGIKVSEDHYYRGIHSFEHGYESMKKILDMEKRPTAVFMTNYEITLGAVMAVNESSLSCPDDISMLGFDDLILSHVTNPAMNMVVQPMKEMSEKGVELLLDKIEKRNVSVTPVEIVLSTRIEAGNSIKKIK